MYICITYIIVHFPSFVKGGKEKRFLFQERQSICGISGTEPIKAGEAYASIGKSEDHFFRDGTESVISKRKVSLLLAISIRNALRPRISLSLSTFTAARFR